MQLYLAESALADNTKQLKVMQADAGVRDLHEAINSRRASHGRAERLGDTANGDKVVRLHLHLCIVQSLLIQAKLLHAERGGIQACRIRL